jgi:hypothetical protein
LPAEFFLVISFLNCATFFLDKMQTLDPHPFHPVAAEEVDQLSWRKMTRVKGCVATQCLPHTIGLKKKHE